MARKADYSNTQKYSNRKSFDGNPVPEGKVLVPFLKEKFGLQKGDFIQDNFTTMHLGEFSFEIGFMAISEDHYASYMKDFWNELNKDMEMRREGRCIIGKNPDGSDKLCPYTRRCKGCPNKGLLKRYNPKRVEILSLDYEYDGSKISVLGTVIFERIGEPDPENVYGKYRPSSMFMMTDDNTADMVYDFSDPGKATISCMLSGTYTLDKETSQLKMDFDAAEEPFEKESVTCIVSGDKLTLTDESGDSITMHRA